MAFGGHQHPGSWHGGRCTHEPLEQWSPNKSRLHHTLVSRCYMASSILADILRGRVFSLIVLVSSNSGLCNERNSRGLYVGQRSRITKHLHRSGRDTFSLSPTHTLRRARARTHAEITTIIPQQSECKEIKSVKGKTQRRWFRLLPSQQGVQDLL